MPFQPFHERKPVRIYFTNLPHWRQEGCTYFVTYRLADSIPSSVLAQWESEKRDWLQRHEIVANEWVEGFYQLDSKQQRAFLKHFNRKLNAFLDEGQGSCILRHHECQRIIVDAWQHFAGLRYELGDLIVMPNHVHLLVLPLPGHDLEEILQSRKSQAARQLNAALNRKGAVWQKHSYDHIVRNETELMAYRHYIAENPVKAGLREGEFMHWIS